MEGFAQDSFQLSPQYGTNVLVLSLAVKKEANLDYEKPEYRRMELTVSAFELRVLTTFVFIKMRYLLMITYLVACNIVLGSALSYLFEVVLTYRSRLYSNRQIISIKNLNKTWVLLYFLCKYRIDCIVWLI